MTQLLKLQQEGDEQLRINESLRSLLMERTKIMAERERLIERLTKSNEDLERFAYSASHDLRSPLQAINSLSLLIQGDLEEQLHDEGRKHLDMLRQRVKRMEKLLDDILTYAHLEHTLKSRPAETVSVKVMIMEIIDILDPASEVRIKTGDALSKINLPRMPLQQVLRNLIDNSIKHNDKTACTIDVNVEENQECYIFSVRDDGRGIEPQYYQRIFEMFQTLKPRDRVEGSGMGLALVKKILSYYNCRITVESVPGQGAQFRFDWPKAVSQSAGGTRKE